MPRAILHKNVLDAAASRPDASLEELADEVSGATVSIVEQVLEEYGDPGETTDGSAANSSDAGSGASAGAESASQGEGEGPEGGDESEDEEVGVSNDEDAGTDTAGEANTDEDEDADADTAVEASVDGDEDRRTAELTADQHSDDDAGETSATSDGTPTASTTADDSTMTTDNSTNATPDVPIDPTALTPRQRETLEEIAARPDATQAALAETLGVTSATISQRVNSIDGFEWSRRREFVADLFDDEDGAVEGARDRDGAGESESSAADGATGEAVLESESESRSEPAVDEDGDESGAGSEDPTRPSYDSHRFDRAESQAVDVEETVDSEPDANSGSDTGGDAVTGANTDADASTEIGSVASTDTRPNAGTDAGPDANTDTGPTVSTDAGSTASIDPDTRSDIDSLTTDIAALSEQLESLESVVRSTPTSTPTSTSTQNQGCLSDPEFAHKVLRACFDAEYISEEDEVRLLRDLVGDGGDSSATE